MLGRLRQFVSHYCIPAGCSLLICALPILPAEQTDKKIRAALEDAADTVVASLASGEKNQIAPETEKFLRRLPSRKGMFVSIFDKKSRKLRGCMGSLVPQKPNLYEEVVHWSTMAMMFDERGTTPQRRKAAYAVIISFIDGVETVGDAAEINSITHGIMVRASGRQELVLPGEAFTTAFALKIISGKLGFRAQRADAEVFRIYAERFGKGIALFKKIDGGYGG